MSDAISASDRALIEAFPPDRVTLCPPHEFADPPKLSPKTLAYFSKASSRGRAASVETRRRRASDTMDRIRDLAERGASPPEIADRLCLTVRTVYSRIYELRSIGDLARPRRLNRSQEERSA